MSFFMRVMQKHISHITGPLRWEKHMSCRKWRRIQGWRVTRERERERERRRIREREMRDRERESDRESERQRERERERERAMLQE